MKAYRAARQIERLMASVNEIVQIPQEHRPRRRPRRMRGPRGRRERRVGAADAVGDLRRSGRPRPADAVDAAIGSSQPRPRPRLVARRLRRRHGQPAERRAPDPLQRARRRAQLRRLGGLVSDEHPGAADGSVRAELPVGQLQGDRVGRRAPDRRTPGLLPAVRSAREARRGQAHRGGARRLARPGGAIQGRLSPHLVQLGRTRRRGGRAPDRRKRAVESHGPDDTCAGRPRRPSRPR